MPQRNLADMRGQNRLKAKFRSGTVEGIFFIIAGRTGDDDICLLQAGLRGNIIQYLHPINVRHQHIQKNQHRRLLSEQINRFLPILRLQDRKPHTAENPVIDIPQRRFIFGD